MNVRLNCVLFVLKCNHDVGSVRKVCAHSLAVWTNEFDILSSFPSFLFRAGAMPRGIKVILLCILVLAAVWVGMMLDRLGRLEFVHDQHGTGLMFMALEERPPPFGGESRS